MLKQDPADPNNLKETDPNNLKENRSKQSERNSGKYPCFELQ